MARPSSFTQETADQICERLANGEPMSVICKDDGMPSYPTVLRWISDFPEFRDSSARAKQHGTHALADQCIEISDDLHIDPQHKRIMVDTRLRLIGKWNRIDYGDKVALEGNVGVAVAAIPTGTLTDEQLRALANIPTTDK